MTFSGRFVLNLIHFAGLQGAPVDQLIGLTGLDLPTLRAEETRLPEDVYAAILDGILQATGDHHFGLHAAEHLNLATAGLICQIVQTSPTVGEAIRHSCAFSQLGCRAVDLSLEQGPDGFQLLITPDVTWERRFPEAARQTVDGNLVFLLRVLDSLTHRPQMPRLLTLTRPRPSDSREYDRIFRCPIRFGEKQTALHFTPHELDQPVLTSDYQLLQLLVGQATQRLQALEQEQGFARQVEQVILGMMRPDFPTVEQAARNLNLSVRSLQRRLREEDTSYKQVLEQLRREMAFDYLRQPGLSVNEIAHLLNYADSSAFIRSFKRWTGRTPEAYRALALAMK
ncbi:MAG: AraC family transcriptional regulator [Lewinella sp.]|nr:AraC family transcriptional regulator [Lewinella sp.]